MFRLIFDSHDVFYYTIDDISRGYKSISLTPSSLQLRLKPLSTDSAQCHTGIWFYFRHYFCRFIALLGFSALAYALRPASRSSGTVLEAVVPKGGCKLGGKNANF